MIKRPTDSRDAAVNEYRRLHGLQPIPYANASSILGTQARGIEVHYELRGVIPLPANAVNSAQAGAAAVFGLQMTSMDGNDGKTQVRVRGTAPRNGNEEYIRTRQLARDRSSTPPASVDINENNEETTGIGNLNRSPCGSEMSSKNSE